MSAIMGDYPFPLPGPDDPESVPVGESAGVRVSGRGKTGIAIPFSGDGRGRLVLHAGEPQLRKIILMNLADLESENPFQQGDGMGSFMVFSNDDPNTRNEIKRRVGTLFRRLQLADRARLQGPPQFNNIAEKQDLEVNISYLNLEENKPEELGLTMSKARPDTTASLLGAMR